MSYELYLTHVAIRALMNIIGIKTFYFQNYVLCILISLFLTYTIIKLQKKLIYDNRLQSASWAEEWQNAQIPHKGSEHFQYELFLL